MGKCKHWAQEGGGAWGWGLAFGQGISISSGPEVSGQQTCWVPMAVGGPVGASPSSLHCRWSPLSCLKTCCSGLPTTRPAAGCSGLRVVSTPPRTSDHHSLPASLDLGSVAHPAPPARGQRVQNELTRRGSFPAGVAL